MSNDTRSQLLAHAEALVRTHGYAGFSYNDLSLAVGIRKASIHYHFPSKTDLALALLENYGERYDHAMEAIRSRTDDGLERVSAYAELYLKGIENNQGCLCAAFSAELITLPEEIRAGVTAFFQRHVDWLEQVLREGRRNGTINKKVVPAHSARMVMATLEGALLMERLLSGTIGFKQTLSVLRSSLR